MNFTKLTPQEHNSSWQVPSYECFVSFPKKTRYCLVIPVINEGERIKRQLTRIKELGLASSIDIILADGGSVDGSLEIPFLQTVNVRSLLVLIEKGALGSQLRMAYAYALLDGYEGIITVDGNNKDSMESIPLFVRKLDEGFDYVQGSRYIKGGKAINTPRVRYIASRFVHAPVISMAAGKRLTDTTNGYRAYSSAYLLHPQVRPFRNIFVFYELLAYLSARASRLNLRVTEVPVTRAYPKNMKVPTKISPMKGNLRLLMTLISLLLGKFNP